ncbi:hypothetical protein [Azospirillum melinis]
MGRSERQDSSTVSGTMWRRSSQISGRGRFLPSIHQPLTISAYIFPCNLVAFPPEPT